MPVNLTPASLDKLRGVDARLVRVVKRAALLSTIPFIVVEGLRSIDRQKQLYAQGRTVPGKIVTWTLKSKHIDGKALDVAPIKDGVILWNRPDLFQGLAKIMMQAAKDEGVAIVWGGNWDGDDKPGEKGETDGPHFQLAN